MPFAPEGLGNTHGSGGGVQSGAFVAESLNEITMTVTVTVTVSVSCPVPGHILGHHERYERYTMLYKTLKASECEAGGHGDSDTGSLILSCSVTECSL